MDLSTLEGRIGGFYEIVEILQWPRTQVSNRMRREAQRTPVWVSGQLPRPLFRIHATPIFDLVQYYEFISGAAYEEHRHTRHRNFYPVTNADKLGWQEQ